jgi:hypothetical protein
VTYFGFLLAIGIATKLKVENIFNNLEGLSNVERLNRDCMVSKKISNIEDFFTCRF